MFRVLFSALILLTSCSKNPVTGKTELTLVSESDERELGQSSYFATQQVEGGRLSGFSELQSYVQEVGRKIAKSSARPNLPYEFVILDNSVPNAWSLPGGKIGINRGLLVELENEGELAAVLSHEIVHAAARHGAKALERGIVMKGGLAAIGQLGYRKAVVGAGAVGASLLTHKFSRNAELEADSYGMEYMYKAGYHPYSAVTLQEKFLSFQNGKKRNLFLDLFASHPPSQERIEKNRATADRLGPYGEIGGEVYLAKVAPLIDLQGMFHEVEEGFEALDRNNFNQAEKHAHKALSLYPNYAKGHFLLGVLKNKMGNPEEALTHLDRAIEIDPNFYAYYLERAYTHNTLNLFEREKEDLKLSLTCLDTADAHYALGMIALDKGRDHKARAHFLLAAQSDTREGRKSQKLLTKLEVPNNPGKYLHLSFALDQEGRLMVLCENNSPVVVNDVEVAIYVKGPSGLVGRPNRFTIYHPIRPKGREVLQTQIGPFNGIAQIDQNVTGKVVAARAKI